MVRSELISSLAEQFPRLTKSDTEACVTTILDSITHQLCEGGRVEIRCFGSFQSNLRPSRVGHNPKTGVKVYVPAKPCPHFKAGLELRERVND
jgi:integration host factor subunit beta